MPMPTIRYKPSADCAYTQLISKIKGVNEQAKVPSSSQQQQSAKMPTKESPPKTDVEVKKLSNGLMLAQYYNSDSDDEEKNENNDDKGLPDNDNKLSQQPNGNSQISDVWPTPTLNPEIPLPSDVLCPPPELRGIIEKTASYVLKNGKDFEDILRTKNDPRFTFLQFTDPYYKYYTFKLTGIVCPDASVRKNAYEMDSQPKKPNISSDHENQPRTLDVTKPLSESFATLLLLCKSKI